jgi:hypothetical protein
MEPIVQLPCGVLKLRDHNGALERSSEVVCASMAGIYATSEITMCTHSCTISRYSVLNFRFEDIVPVRRTE